MNQDAMIEATDELVPVIGLEVHVQLCTKSKLFAPDFNVFGSEANENISDITMAHPGALPVLNKEAISMAIKLGLALDCEIDRLIRFDRKNYFYPDLPKGYQLTQQHFPVCKNGGVWVYPKSKAPKFIKLTKIHIEEDAGKQIHAENESFTRVDLNRAGVPLLEIVTDPVIETSEEAALFISEIRRLVRYLGISDGNMEEGSLRCDANVSVHAPGTDFGNKVEIKNLNSMKFIARAVDLEIARQKHLKATGAKVAQETRTFNPDTGKSATMRTKETADDYRYFPEPDVTPVYVDDQWFTEIHQQMPLLPWQFKQKFMEAYGIAEADALILMDELDMARYYDQAASLSFSPKNTAGILLKQIKFMLNEQNMGIALFPIQPKQVADISNQVTEGHISHSAVAAVLQWLSQHPHQTVDVAIQTLDVKKDSDSEKLEALIDDVLNDMPEKAREYQQGKKGLLGLFMGELMKKTGGKADPKLANQLMLKKLNEVK